MTAHALERLAERVTRLEPAAALREIRGAIAAGDAIPIGTHVNGKTICEVYLSTGQIVFPVLGDEHAVCSVLTEGMKAPLTDREIVLQRTALGEGEHDICDAVYFGDPCATPSLSAGMGKDFIKGTPLHAWTNSKRLNPFWEDKNNTNFDIGHAFHAMMLSQGADIHVIDAADYRKADARDERDEAYARGLTPLLTKQIEAVENMETAARLQLNQHHFGDPFTGKDAERTLIWKQDGVWNRCKVDQVDRENRILWDLKSCAGYAEPSSWLMTNLRLGIDMRVAHYLDGAQAVWGGDWRYRLVPVEKEPPHGLSVIELHPDTITIGRKKITRAREMLRRCLERESWPGYAAETYIAEAPAWFTNDWLEREFADADFKKRHNKDVLDFAFQMQAPH